MSYALKYTIPFKTIDDVDCLIELHQKNHIGGAVELKGGASPIAIDVEDVDLDAPIRSSGATIEIFGSDYLQDLYTSDPFGIKVVFKIEGQNNWLGYVTQDTFSQDFSNPEFTYQVECVSALSVLKYRKMDIGLKKLSFLEIIKQAITISGYDKGYLTNTVRTVQDGNLYSSFNLAAANFVDEIGEVNTYYEALEEIAKFVTCTFTSYRDSLMLLNYDAIKKGENYYYRVDSNPIVAVKFEDITTVQQLGYKGTGATISRIGGKNKASVNCSLYEIESDVMHELSRYGMQFLYSSKYLWEQKNNNITAVESIYSNVSNEGFNTYLYGGGPNAMAYGSQYVEYSEFPTDEPPSQLGEQSLIVFDRGGIERTFNPALKCLTLRSKGDTITSGGERLIINYDYRATYGTKYDLGKEGGANHTSNSPMQMRAILRYGDLYYNGTSWQSWATEFFIFLDRKEGEKLSEWISVVNENTYELGLGGSRGMVANAPSGVHIGDIELTIFAARYIYARWEHFKGISLTVEIPEQQFQFGDFVREDSKNDLIYEREIHGDYVEEVEEVNLNICTKPDNKIGYSCVFDQGGFIQSYKYLGENIKPEHNIINKRVHMFSKTRFAIHPTLRNDLKPFSLITDANLPNVKFLNGGSVDDIKMGSATYNLIEL